MSKRQASIPSYRRHRASGQAVVTLNGVDHYLGSWNGPQSKAQYDDRLVSEWTARGRSLPTAEEATEGRLVKEVIAGYYTHAVATMPDVEVEKVKAALRPVRELYGETEAAKFNAVSYAALRIKLVDSGLCISTIRARLGIIKRMIAWGISRELIPDKVLNLIKAFKKAEPLRVGQSGVKPSREVKPAPPEDIVAILPHLNPTVRAMVELQALTGARPGEIWRMTTGAIDRTADPWVYKLPQHKTRRYGKTREILLGPKAQTILLAWLKADPDAPLFSPIETVERRNASRRAARKTPHTPSSRARARTRKKNPKRPPRQWYDKNSYAWAIARGCLAAGVPVFKPNQIRHTLATKVRREFGLKYAQVVLGHSRADITQRYAETNQELAVEVAREIG